MQFILVYTMHKPWAIQHIYNNQENRACKCTDTGTEGTAHGGPCRSLGYKDCCGCYTDNCIKNLFKNL